MPEWLKYLGGGLALLVSSGLIQYFITRHDNRHDRVKKLEEDMHKGLDDREATGKARYDEHHEAIEELRKAMITLSESMQETHQIATAIGDLTVGLGQDKLVYLTDKYQKRNAITIKEKAGLRAIYIPYHDKLGGNGYGTVGYEYCMNELPVISDEEAFELDKNGGVYHAK